MLGKRAYDIGRHPYEARVPIEKHVLASASQKLLSSARHRLVREAHLGELSGRLHRPGARR
jgi:hypothetical protein